MPIAHLDRTRLAQALPSQLKEGTVLDPPTTTDGWLRVEVDGQPGVVKLCPWLPRLDLAAMPKDAVLTAESDEGNTWVVAWWSQSGIEPTPPGGGTDLPTLGAGQGWVGPAFTPTDIATQAELDAEAAARAAAVSAEATARSNADALKADLTDSRFPTAGEKAALAGTTGAPGAGNKYVTDTDPRLASTGGATRAFAIAVS